MTNATSIHAHPLAILNAKVRLIGLNFRQTLEDEYEHENYKVYRVQTLLFDQSSQTSETFDGFGSSIKAARKASATSALSSHLMTLRLNELHEKSQARLAVHANDLHSRLQLDAVEFTPRNSVEDLLLVAKLLRVPLKKVAGPPELHPGSTNKRALPISRGFVFGGCRFVSQAKDTNSAEQAASRSILSALRSAILRMNTTDFGSKELSDCSSSSGPLPINSFVWRLHVLCTLHDATPTFTVEEEEDGEGSVKYVCICSLQPLGAMEAHARTQTRAKEMAARLMFDRLKALPSRISELVDSPLSSQSPTKESGPPKLKGDTAKGTSRPENQFMLARISAGYGGSIHPVSRLEMIQTAKKKSRPSYHPCPVDERLTPTESTSRKLVLANKTKLLRYSKHRVAFSYNKEVRLYEPPLNPRGPDHPLFRPSRSIGFASLGVRNEVFQFNSRRHSAPAPQTAATSILGRRARSKSPHWPTNAAAVLSQRSRSSGSLSLSVLHRSRPKSTPANHSDDYPTAVATVRVLPTVGRRRRRRRGRRRRALTHPLQVDHFFSKDEAAQSVEEEEETKTRQNLHCPTFVEDFSWRLLCQLSQVCYTEHADHHNPAITSAAHGKATTFTADQQLITLCERLRIPCQFTQLTKAENCRLTPENDFHHHPSSTTHVAHVRFLLQLGSHHITGVPNFAVTASCLCTAVSPATTCACSTLHKQQQGGCFLGQGVTGTAARHQAALQALKCLAHVVC